VIGLTSLTEPSGDGDGDADGEMDGDGLAAVFELVPPGSVAQPAATIERAIASPSVVGLMNLIKEYLGY
jgi:hypothetical protein